MNINSFSISKGNKIFSHDFGNSNVSLFNNNNNLQIENNFNKTNEMNNTRLSDYSNKLILNSNTCVKNEFLNGVSKIDSNLNSFLDLISESEISCINKNLKIKHSYDDLTYRNRVINEKLNKILCQINEVEFRMNIYSAEEHYVFTIENYLLDSISIILIISINFKKLFIIKFLEFGNLDPTTIEYNHEKLTKILMNTEVNLLLIF